MKNVSPDWKIVDNHHLERAFKFPDWKTALAFVNKVGDVAEELGHHPDVELGWGRVVLRLRTHDEKKVGAKDFLLAERVDTLPLPAPK